MVKTCRGADRRRLGLERFIGNRLPEPGGAWAETDRGRHAISRKIQNQIQLQIHTE